MIDELVAWLLDQVAEDERRARAVDHVNNWMPARVVAECGAKRELVQLHSVRSGTGGDSDDRPAICNEDGDLHPCGTLRLLVEPYASPYAHRSGFRRVWLT